MPHYNARSMPAVSLHQGLHFLQLYRTRRFQLYDYGSPGANLARYGHAAPPDGAPPFAPGWSAGGRSERACLRAASPPDY
jgi:hypothetical protein